MEIEGLKNMLECCRRAKGGRRLLGDSLKDQIRECFQASGLEKAAFAEAVGLSFGTIYKILRVPSGRKQPRQAQPTFHEIKLSPQKSSSWSVMGPNGLRVECNFEQLTILWRALC